jgi:Outer membrane protein beta-barrel domain
MKRLHQSIALSILLPVFTASLCAQRISLDIGVDAGIPFTKSLNEEAARLNFAVTQVTIERPAFVVGPAIELRVGQQFGVEVDGLYRPVRFQTQEADAHITFLRSTRATSVELPVLAKYRFNAGGPRPFAEFGFIVYDRLWGTTTSHGILHDQGDRETNVVFHYQPGPSGSSPPFVAGGGFEFYAGSFRWSPKVRYTRWIDDPVRRKNQWDFLLEIKYEAKILRHF